MKLHVNMPDINDGEEVEVMHVGPVKNGSTVELTDSQVFSLRDAGYDVPSDGSATIKTYSPVEADKVVELKTTNLPGIAEIAEKERAKTARTTKKEGDK